MYTYARLCWAYCWSHVLPTFLDFCCAFSYDPFGDKMSSTEVIFEKWPHNLCEPRQWSCFSWGINFTDPCLCFKHLRLMCDISLWRFSSDNHKYLKAYPHLQNAFLQKLPDIYIYILKRTLAWSKPRTKPAMQFLHHQIDLMFKQFTFIHLMRF